MRRFQFFHLCEASGDANWCIRSRRKVSSSYSVFFNCNNLDLYFFITQIL